MTIFGSKFGKKSHLFHAGCRQHGKSDGIKAKVKEGQAFF